MVFGGVFASFCRRGQKAVAPEREISLWRKNKKRAVGDAGPYECEKGGSERNALGGAERSLLKADTAAQAAAKKL